MCVGKINPAGISGVPMAQKERNPKEETAGEWTDPEDFPEEANLKLCRLAVGKSERGSE